MNLDFSGMKKCPLESPVGQLNDELCVIVLQSAFWQPILTPDLHQHWPYVLLPLEIRTITKTITTFL